jgi:two-component system response regulator HydG
VQGKILVVDDETDTADLLREALRKRGFDAHSVYSPTVALDRLASEDFDVVVTDIQMPEMTGIEMCEALRARDADAIAIMITGVGGLDAAIAACRAGVFDFLTKPVKSDVLAVAVARGVEHRALARELKRLRGTVKARGSGDMVGHSTALDETTAMIERVAASDATVLVTGESGTGKELVARAVHARSTRAGQPFVAVNCGAIPAPLLESELFGHVKGAFTDAQTSRRGLFVQAGDGTVFLDEIAEMPSDMQVKLLRCLQERMVRPVGGDAELPFRARIIAATNRDLEQEVEDKRFRQDLFYRINVVQIAVPPLRARDGDVLLLAQYFLERGAARNNKAVDGISSAAARLLVDYDWPGNVRELENCMERAVAICRLSEITVDDLPTRMQVDRASLVVSFDSPAEMVTLPEMERRYIRYVLKTLGNNKTHAARALGIDRRSLYRRLADPAFREDAEKPQSPSPIDE